MPSMWASNNVDPDVCRGRDLYVRHGVTAGRSNRFDVGGH